jgi:hypothetical protein
MLKGKIKENHIPLNTFELIVAGMPQITLTKTDNIEEGVQVIELPDRTRVSGGQTNSVSFSGEIPMHHDVEVAALEAWYKMAQAPVDPNYRKAGSLMWYRSNGDPRPFELINLWVSKRTIPGGDMSNDGEPAYLTFQFEADEVTPV